MSVCPLLMWTVRRPPQCKVFDLSLGRAFALVNRNAFGGQGIAQLSRCPLCRSRTCNRISGIDH
jgi:hypothetical protein